MKTLALSVVMPVYNGEKYIKDSIKSILNQTFKDFELIIINDGSTDKTLKIIEQFKEKRIFLYNNKKNLGVAKSLNVGLKLAKGKYIARIDADDLNYPNRFEIQVKFLNQNPEYVLIGSNADWIDRKGNLIPGFKVKLNDSELRKWMFFRNQFFHSSVMFRSSAVKLLGYYNEVLNGVEDYDLWFKMLRIGKVANISKSLIKRRIHENVVTKNKHFKIELLAIIVRLINLPFSFKK